MSDLPNGSTLQYRVHQLEETVRSLEEKVDKLVLAIVGAALTFAVGVAVFAITLASTRGRS